MSQGGNGTSDTNKSMFTDPSAFDEPLGNPTLKWTPETLHRLSVAIHNRDTADGRRLQTIIDRNLLDLQPLIRDITECEELTAEDLAIRVNTLD